jgi:hypothetical protein
MTDKSPKNLRKSGKQRTDARLAKDKKKREKATGSTSATGVGNALARQP